MACRHGAEFGEKAGWERVNWYASNESDELAVGAESLRPDGWAGRSWSPAIVAEHRAAREHAALFDETSFAKIEVSGPDSGPLLDYVCDNRVARAVGAITYTQMLNRRGGIEADVTVTRTGAEEFLVVSGTAFGEHDLSWLRRQADQRSARVQVREVTGQYVCFGLWGPRAREVLAPLTPQDLSNAAFPFMSSRWTTIGDIPVRVARVTFVGELGWELYASSEYGAALWASVGGREAVRDARGRLSGDRLAAAGEGLPGLGRGCDAGDHAGRGRAVVLREAGQAGRFSRCPGRAPGTGRRRSGAAAGLPDAVRSARGGRRRRAGQVGERVAGRITSAGYGYTVGASIAYAYLPIEDTAPGTRISVDLFGEWVDGEVAADVLYDPTSARVRA